MHLALAGIAIVVGQFDAVIYIAVDRRCVAVVLRCVLVDVDGQQHVRIRFERQFAEIIEQVVYLARVDHGQIGGIPEDVENRTFLDALRDFVLGIRQRADDQTIVGCKHLHQFGIGFVLVGDRVLVLEVPRLVVAGDVDQQAVRPALAEHIAVEYILTVKPERHGISLVEAERIILDDRKFKRRGCAAALGLPYHTPFKHRVLHLVCVILDRQLDTRLLVCRQLPKIFLACAGGTCGRLNDYFGDRLGLRFTLLG